MVVALGGFKAPLAMAASARAQFDRVLAAMPP